MNSQSVKPPTMPEPSAAAITIQFMKHSPANAASLAGNDVEGDGGARLAAAERHRAVPHIRREQHQPPGARLHRLADWIVQAHLDVRLAELYPALLGRLVRRL